MKPEESDNYGFVWLIVIFIAIWAFTAWRKSKRAPKKTFSPIPNQFDTLEQVQTALRRAGLESSNLIIGVDYTASNDWSGQRTFGGKCLHKISPGSMNPYQAAINIIGKTLEVYDDDKLIPAFGFGDASTSDHSIFAFKPDGPCFTFQEVLKRYNEITPAINLGGPTSFAPLIRAAIDIVKANNNSYHILVIVADGQVSAPPATVQAIVDASNYPLSIIMVGVGDGPWDMMEEFDDGLPARKFDNFQFVNFHEIMTKFDGREAPFAISAMQEIPDQYRAICQLGLLGRS